MGRESLPRGFRQTSARGCPYYPSVLLAPAHLLLPGPKHLRHCQFLLHGGLNLNVLHQTMVVLLCPDYEIGWEWGGGGTALSFVLLLNGSCSDMSTWVPAKKEHLKNGLITD
jgi:hypothetical protein